MYTLFYILAYLSFIAFVILAIIRTRTYLKDSPLHIRWELYPIPHEGPKRASYGGSYMEESNWWTKKRHVDHWMDIKAIFEEVLLLKATYDNNRPLWLRSFPFHWGLYFLMGGTMLLNFAVILILLGVNPDNGFMIFIGNVINSISLFGALGILGGGIGLVLLRRENYNGMGKYTAFEQWLNLYSFIAFALLTLCAWTFNPSYYLVSCNFIFNLYTGNFTALGSTWFVLNMLAGFFVLIWIPVTNMRHLIMKYWMYHDIRWGDEATVWSHKNQEIIPEMLHYESTWSAKHISEDGKNKNWVEIATSNPADQQK